MLPLGSSSYREVEQDAPSASSSKPHLHNGSVNSHPDSAARSLEIRKTIDVLTHPLSFSESPALTYLRHESGTPHSD